MNAALQEYLESAPHLYPHALERRFARIVEKIAVAWSSPERMTAVFDDLLIDRRGGRQGFPPEIAREIFQLSVAYESLGRTQNEARADVWEHERPTAIVEELGMRLVPSDMLRAAEEGDTDRLAHCLRSGILVDARDARDWTPLMVAAFNGREAAAKLLIEHGANPRARDRGGYTPLHWAALKGYEDVVELIISRVDCNVRSAAGLTPLLQAAASGHVAVVQLLITAGADPNVPTRDGWTPLHKAVANRHEAVVALLIASGASVLTQHAHGTTVISLAARRDDGILQMLRSALRMHAAHGQKATA
jgi:ankyrin repeat protein